MNLPKRKPTRLKGFNYSRAGAYFVTICTHNRKCILSHIVGEGLCTLPKNELTQIGTEVDKCIQYINNHSDNINIEKYVIMPNHIHLIVMLNNTGGRGSPPLQSIVRRLKTYTTNKFGATLWQRSFHDHIIRDEADYEKIWNYIDSNVLRWELDCFYNSESKKED